MTSQCRQQGLPQLAEGRGERACPPGEADGAAGEVQGAFREDELAVGLVNNEGLLAGWRVGGAASGGRQVEAAGDRSSMLNIVVSSFHYRKHDSTIDCAM